MPIDTRTRRTLGTVLAATVVGWLALASPAAAHVSVSSSDATPGGEGKVTFRVPNEETKSATTRVVVTIPVSVVFTEVAAQSKPGWRVSITEAKLPTPAKVMGSTVTKAVRSITWTATGSGIGPSEFDEFSFAGGPFPAANTVRFSVDQGYDDGRVVRWNEHGNEDQVEHPAPTLALAVAPSETSEGTGWLATWLIAAASAVAAVSVASIVRQNRNRATSD